MLGLPPLLGIAVFPDHGGDGASLLARADEAMYEAKESGRDRIVEATQRQSGDNHGAS